MLPSGKISLPDLSLVQLTDDVDEALAAVLRADKTHPKK